MERTSLSKSRNIPNSLLFSCGTDIRQIFISQWPYRSQYYRAGKGYTYRWPNDQKEMMIILISRKLQAICGLESSPGDLWTCIYVFQTASQLFPRIFDCCILCDIHSLKYSYIWWTDAGDWGRVCFHLSNHNRYFFSLNSLQLNLPLHAHSKNLNRA